MMCEIVASIGEPSITEKLWFPRWSTGSPYPEPCHKPVVDSRGAGQSYLNGLQMEDSRLVAASRRVG